MIILFHYLSNLIYKFFHNRLSIKTVHPEEYGYVINPRVSPDHRPLARRDAENDIKFDPPVYKQRYERVSDILTDEKWINSIEKIVDFGCAEFGLFVFLKNSLKRGEISFVDIDESVLMEYLFRIYPLNADYLYSYKRSEKFSIKVFCGSISHPDPVLVDTDAVIAIEMLIF